MSARWRIIDGWGAILARAQFTLSIATGKRHSVIYIGTLQKHLLPFYGRHYASDFTFQQDDALVRTSYVAKQWLAAKTIKTMAWPDRSLNLNRIENI